MTDDLQPKIDKWWADLTPEEQWDWWGEGDYAVCNSSKPYLVLDKDFTKSFICKTGTPAPCPQLWWKLEAWLGDNFIHMYHMSGGGTWHYFIGEKRFDHKDRRHALLDACLAVQRGEG